MTPSGTHEASRSSQGDRIRVMIVDDHSVVLSGLRLALEFEGFDVAATAETAEEAIRLCLELEPDVLLLDIHMPHQEGFEVLERLKQEGTRTKIIMLTASLRSEDRRKAEALGAHAYVSKEILTDQLAEVIRRSVQGEFSAEAVIGDSGRSLAADTQPSARTADLTEQEMQVLRLIATGMDNSEISQELYVSINTVKSHVTSILSKLGVDNRTQAAVWAFRHFDQDKQLGSQSGKES